MGSSDHGRFQHLLQPIRDLAKNWDIDIAGQLEEYLEEIEHITISFDGGASKMNFAEAALLIQGSACIYSKKVEYLYALVYEVLDHLIKNKKQAAAKKKGGEGGGDDDVADAHDDEEEFLSLDDIKVLENTNLDEGDQVEKCETLMHYYMNMIGLCLEKSADKTEPIFSAKKELVGDMKDFRVNNSHWFTETGMLVLESRDLLGQDHLVPDMSLHTSNTAEPSTKKDEAEVEEQQEPVCNNSMQADPEDDGDMPELPSMDIQPEEEGGRNGMELRPRSSLRRALVRQKPAEPKQDPWEMLDPHEAGSLTEKAFKKGKTYKIPKCLRPEFLDQGMDQAANLPPINEFINSQFYSNVHKYPRNPLKVPTLPDFDRLYWKEHKKRQALRQKQKQLLMQKQRYEEVEEIETQEQEEAHDDPGLPGLEDIDDDIEANGMDSPQGELQFPDLDFDHHDHERSRDHSFLSSVMDEADLPTSYEDLVRHYVDMYLASSEKFVQTTELAKRVQAWEEKIKPRLEEEDKHGPFDIHVYGTIIIEHLQKESDPVVPFARIGSKRKDWEVSRLFAAALQLANSYNVEISWQDSTNMSMDTMALRLLSTRRLHEQVEEYRAPSLQKT